MYVCTPCMCLWRSKEGVGSPGTGVTDCVSCHVAVWILGTESGVLWKSSQCLTFGDRVTSLTLNPKQAGWPASNSDLPISASQVWGHRYTLPEAFRFPHFCIPRLGSQIHTIRWLLDEYWGFKLRCSYLYGKGSKPPNPLNHFPSFCFKFFTALMFLLEVFQCVLWITVEKSWSPSRLEALTSPLTCFQTETDAKMADGVECCYKTWIICKPHLGE